MTTFRTDAPAPCGHQVTWVDSPNGPRAEPCKCAKGSATQDAIGDAQARVDAEARKAYEGGPPAGTSTRRRS